MSEKAVLRKQIRATLRDRSPQVRAEASAALRQRLLALPAWVSARTVGLFAATPGEPDLDPLLAAARAAGKIAVYPCVEGSGVIFRPVAALDELIETPPWNLREPPRKASAFSPEMLDLLLVPGLAFDPQGGRLGRGGGFYDRLLAQISADRRIGVCFECQVVPEIPKEGHDQSVGHLVTEARG